jgi:uncharacterized protein YjhX (UPF0386 family)
MSRSLLTSSLVLAAVLAPAASAQDSSFAAMQRRGRIAMGVDQYTSIHKFDDLADGGRIELQRDRDDAMGIRAIRDHLRAIERAFSTGDFSTPAFVHMRDVPGTKVMAARRALIRYRFESLPRGGQLRITTADSSALEAVHRFLAFQRDDHHAAGHAMHGTNPRR